MRTICRTLMLLAAVGALYGCNHEKKPVTEGPAPLVTAPEPIYFTEEECSAIRTAMTTGGGVYFALEANLEGFDTVRLVEKDFQKRFAELFWKNSRAMVWTMQVNAPAATPPQTLTIPIFAWGENFDLGADPIRLPDRRSRQLVTPYMLTESGIGLRLALNYTDKPEVDIAQRLTEVVKFGVMLSGAVPGTHSVATLFTSQVADRIDRSLADFFSDSQKPAFQPATLTGAEVRRQIPCSDRQIGLRYRLTHDLLPKKTATIEFKTVFALSQFATSRNGGYPNYEGASLKKFEEYALEIATAGTGAQASEITKKREILVKYASTLTPLSASWETLLKARNPETLDTLCPVLKETAREKIKLNTADTVAFIAYVHRYMFEDEILQARMHRCLGPDGMALLGSLNFSPASIQTASAGPAAGRLSAALSEYGRQRPSGEDAAWAKLLADLKSLISDNQVTFYEFPYDRSKPRLLKLDDGKEADGMLAKPGYAALVLLDSLLKGKYQCGVDKTKHPTARWYQIEPKGDSVGPVSRIDLTEYGSHLIDNKPGQCYARVDG